MSRRLTTERLELLPFADDHLDFLHALWTDPDVRRYLWDDRAISRREAAEAITSSRASFEEHGFGFWVVLPPEGEPGAEPIGFAGLRRFSDAGEVEILYGLAPEWWHRGLATEAAREILRFAFEDLRLAEVFAGADPPNARSFRVMERLGLSPHGRRVIHGLEAEYWSITQKQYSARARSDLQAGPMS